VTTRTKTYLTLSIIACLFAVVISAVFVFFPARLGLAQDKEPGNATKDTALPVNVIVVQKVTSFETKRSYTGRITPRRAAELNFEQPGKLLSVSVEEGDQVSAEQTVATIDARRVTAKLQQVAAELARAEATLIEMKAPARTEQVQVAEAEIAELTAQLKLDELNFKRRQSLLQQNVITEEDFDSVRFGLAGSQARLEAAQQRLIELKAGARTEKVAIQQAVVDSWKAQHAAAEFDVADCVLKAPFAGVIAARHVDEGEYVTPQVPIVRLVETDRLEAWVGVPIDVATELKLSDPPFKIEIRGVTFEATLKTKKPEVDPKTRTQTIIFNLKTSSSHPITPGETVRLLLTQKTTATGFWVPVASLSSGVQGLWSAFVVNEKDGREVVAKRDVEVLYTDGEKALVRGALKEGDRIIADGVHRLAPGQAVKVTTANSQTGKER